MDDLAPAPPRVRIALVGCSGLLGDIIGRALAREHDLEVVADLAVPEPGQELGTIDADLVVWNDADDLRATAWLTGRGGRPRVLTTVSDGRGASLWQLVPQRTELGELSPAALVAEIRRLPEARGEAT